MSNRRFLLTTIWIFAAFLVAGSMSRPTSVASFEEVAQSMKNDPEILTVQPHDLSPEATNDSLDLHSSSSKVRHNGDAMIYSMMIDDLETQMELRKILNLDDPSHLYDEHKCSFEIHDLWDAPPKRTAYCDHWKKRQSPPTFPRYHEQTYKVQLSDNIPHSIQELDGNLFDEKSTFPPQIQLSQFLPNQANFHEPPQKNDEVTKSIFLSPSSNFVGSIQPQLKNQEMGMEKVQSVENASHNTIQKNFIEPPEMLNVAIIDGQEKMCSLHSDMNHPQGKDDPIKEHELGTINCSLVDKNIISPDQDNKKRKASQDYNKLSKSSRSSEFSISAQQHKQLANIVSPGERVINSISQGNKKPKIGGENQNSQIGKVHGSTGSLSSEGQPRHFEHNIAGQDTPNSLTSPTRANIDLIGTPEELRIKKDYIVSKLLPLLQHSQSHSLETSTRHIDHATKGKQKDEDPLLISEQKIQETNSIHDGSGGTVLQEKFSSEAKLELENKLKIISFPSAVYFAMPGFLKDARLSKDQMSKIHDEFYSFFNMIFSEEVNVQSVNKNSNHNKTSPFLEYKHLLLGKINQSRNKTALLEVGLQILMLWCKSEGERHFQTTLPIEGFFLNHLTELMKENYTRISESFAYPK
ncbi:hypothetical protein MJO28_011970 [Puccinia striiformis f. sp. tritici]|uniref:Uncharacterized protein n=2 Tax=Puccinia striiformis f. sp. tritici TaxID=168172 RepID=A0A0L0VD93_9BASI|nr:hypothetical protein MJO28_011970 [Puccinia striiformis f. sp. tritici]KAI9631040.1 hypothetical protein KEM48_013296 [Puccinia striiformis f. sp. tritici PST-130]KNE97255.1 hypothetical protein PSTG_09517 [Puccinia striiformis f. sp. tritici PST-78]